MCRTAREAGVRIVTGDTQVVARGAADKLFITTSGVGVVITPGIGRGGKAGRRDNFDRIDSGPRHRGDAGPREAARGREPGK